MPDTPSPASSWASSLSFHLRGYFLNLFGRGAFGSGKYGPRDSTRDNWTRVKNQLSAFACAAILATAAADLHASDSYTTNLQLRQPEVDVEDPDMSWGEKINDNYDILEAAICDKRTGCTMAGGVTMTTASVTQSEFSVGITTFVINRGVIRIATTGVTGYLGVGAMNPATRLHVSSGGAIFDGTNAAVTLTPIAAPTATKGKLYYDSSTDLLRYSRDGSTFVDLATGSVSGNFVNLQAATPGTQQSGNSNVSGAGIFGSSVVVTHSLVAKSSVAVMNGTSVAFGVDSNGIVHSTTQPAARWTRSAAMSIANNTNTTLNFVDRDYNTQSLFAVSHATVPTGGDGIYDTRCFVSFATNKDGRRAIWVEKNGTIITGCKMTFTPVSGDETQLAAECHPHLVATDAVSCVVFQSSGGALNVNIAAIEVLKR